jgi:hypothetical protein
MSKRTPTNSASKAARHLETESPSDGINQAAAPAEGQRRLARIGFRKALVGLPVALAFFSSLNTLWNDFVSDDTQQILGNLFIRDLKNLPFALTTIVWSFASSQIGATAQPN